LKGDLKSAWARYGVTDGTAINASVAFPVSLSLQSSSSASFDAELQLRYSNKSGTSGSATLIR
ncbi:MAG TPA: hypothetical protein VLZ30_04900, partial [Verrucomicrobiae bacterium]|nr:hypothetical protein [Verrucomicrobiae bacterium]